ncbi:TetR/AcrR family transcriptional regulator [Alginatibacterium sediminis]|uniref:TetR/AcrR family transcriptional regulator n=1 Tax=Alginatibacterium sediminis TaxID=2164068 RepID=A0A420E6S0_9ALTE|nr:TetR/AcrR family transcriptional regulator [Alginatibacterium sediminis]RKF13683.1 TetR/AcrR family transcriptional regulator [Alginatibacterium sediminis]
MPKIVDHEGKRSEIALKAAQVFHEHGYKGLGMRQLCEYLGMSKSAVYYYYKSKDEIFKAATEASVNLDVDSIKLRPVSELSLLELRCSNFYSIFELMAERYFQEMKLVSEYIEVIGLANVANDPSMQLANNKYAEMLANYVSRADKDVCYTLLLGLLTQQTMQGYPLTKAYIIQVIGKQLSKD